MENLNPIFTPDTVPYWPLGPAWYVLAAVIVLVLLWIAYRLYRRWQRNAYRRVALAQLKVLSGELQKLETRRKALQDLAALLKRVALSRFPREEVASLSGEAWLAFLSKTSRGADFQTQAGHLMISGSYQKAAVLEAISDDQLGELTALAQRWIERHHV